MLDIIKNHSKFLLIVFAMFNIAIILTIDAYAERINEVASINITKENGSEIEIKPKYLLDLDEASKVFSSTDLNSDEIKFSKGEIINIEYKSPCGFPDSIEGIFLDGSTDITVKGFSEISGSVEAIKFNGEQNQFYMNSSPEKQGVDNIEIPSSLENKFYEFVIVMDCDEELIYYSTFVEITG